MWLTPNANGSCALFESSVTLSVTPGAIFSWFHLALPDIRCVVVPRIDEHDSYAE